MIIDIDDSVFDTDEVRLLFRGDNVLHNSDKKIIGAVVRYYLDGPDNNENKKYGTAIRNKMKKVVGNETDGIKIYETLMKEFNCKTNEKLLAYILLGCKPYKDDLTIKMTHVFGRVQRLKHPNDWLNNFTINAYIDVLTLTVFHEFDSADMWSVSQEKAKRPNESITLDWAKCKKHLVGSFREFLIRENLIPNCDTYKVLEELRGKKITSMTDKDIVDVSQMVFACNSVGSHGCDCFFIVGMTVSIPEIYRFLKRYPSSTIFGVINTQTYRSGNGGEHWVYLGFHNGKANLICSEGSDFSGFHDGGCLRRTIEKYFGTDYSMRKIQHDGFNCSFYSVLSAYAMLTNDNNIKAAVDSIGDNATEIVEGKSIKDIRSRLINSEQRLNH